MADNKITIDIEVNGKMQKATLSTKKLRKQLDELEGTQDKVTKGASNLSRNMQGASKRTSNTTKEFSKLQQGMGGVVGIYATIAAQVFAVSAAFQFLKSASDVSNLIAGQEALGAVSGVAYKTLTAGIREATEGQLSFAEASRAAAIGTASGLNPDQLNGLANAAKNASVALGRDLTDSFNRLIRGTTKAEPELLDELGIVLRLDTALSKYGQQIGKTADELNAFERSQAVANEVLGQANIKFGAIEKNLDPGIFALNQFLNSFDELINAFKTGVIDTLRPVFIFLSQNTGALTASLALFALPIVKAIIPNLEDWRESAQKTLAAQQGKYEALSKEAKGYTLDLKNLGKEEKELRKEADKAAKRAGGRTDTTAQGGLAFLQGKESAQTATGMRNADKILKTAEAQLADSSKRRTGTLKHMNAEQVADMRRSYELRARILKKHGIDDATLRKKLELGAKITTTRIEGFYRKMAAGISKASIGMSRAMNAAFAATGIIGFLFLIKDLGTMFLDAFVPGRKELKKLQDEVDDTTDKYETLAGELGNINNAMRDTDITLIQRITQLGNAINTANVDKLINDYERLATLKPGIETEDFKASLEATRREIEILDPQIARFIDTILAGGDAGAQAKQDFENYRNVLIKGQVAVAKYGEASRATAEELTKLAQAQKATTVLDGIEKAASAERDLANDRIASGEISQKNRAADMLGYANEIRSLQNLKRERGERAGAFKARQQEAKDRIAALEEEIKKTAQIITNDGKDLDILKEKRDSLQGFVEILETAIAGQEAAFKKAAELDQQSLEAKTAGFSIEEKRSNLRSAELAAQAKEVRSAANLQAVRDSILAIGEAGTKEDKERLDSLRQQETTLINQNKVDQINLGIVQAKNDLSGALLDTEKQIADLKRDEKVLSVSKELLGAEEKRLSTLQQISDLQKTEAERQINVEARKRKLANPFFDQEAFIRREMLELEENSQEERLKQVRAEAAAKAKMIELEFGLLEVKRQQTILELKNFQKQERKRLGGAGFGADDASRDEEFGLTGVTDLIKNFNDLDYTEAKAAALELNALLLAAEETKLEGILEGLKLGQEEAHGLNQLLETSADAFRDGLTDAVGATFDVITGKTSSLKDALLGITADVLQTIQDKFIEEVIVRPIMDSDFFGKLQEEFTPETLKTTTEQGVSEGIANGGKQLADSVKTAAGEVAGEIEQGGAKAAAKIKSESGCINLCKDRSTAAEAGSSAVTPEETPKSVEVIQETKAPVPVDTTTEKTLSTTGVDGNEEESPISKLGEVMKENVVATGLAVTSLFSNSKTMQKLQKILAAVYALQMIMKLLTKLGIIATKANTAATVAQTAATTAAASGGGGGGGLFGAIASIFGFGSTAKMGLYPPKGYGVGGIARGPMSGYPAVLHGNEAVVPLPDGKTIPVRMQGGGTQQNNVTVNVNIDNEGKGSSQVTGTDNAQASQLGSLVAIAVQKELQNQKRAGGILSPHGVA